MTKGKKLFIVESPTKVNTVKKYLDKSFMVTASVGHCFKLPTKNFVDAKNNFKLRYEPDPKKKDTLKNIVSLAEKCDEIYLATDEDQEGSVISWHLYQHLYKKFKTKKKYFRVNLREITKTGIQSALKKAYDMSKPEEYDIVQAGFLRRIEDRYTGFKLSPLAFIYVQDGTSAGRVQTPALRMIVERQREIDSFVPEVYYEIFANLFPTGTKDVFKAKYTNKVTDQKTADAVVKGCQNKTPTITKITKKQIKSKAPPPFITKTLLASASSILGWKAARTTNVAQQLYQGGHITYIRCDNPMISSAGRSMLASHINSKYSKQYNTTTRKLPNYKNAKAKLEHECIRPTDLSGSPSLPSSDQDKLYDLIKKRFIASGMPPALYDSVTVDLTIGKHKFKASGSTLTFDGYLKEWNYNQKNDTTLPQLDESTALSLRDVFSERKETRPPARYKDATLIDALEKKGIGKPSTFKSILDILEKRQYIKYDKQALVPTDLGFRLNDFLTEYFLNVIDYDFTARVEAAQEDVAQGKRNYEDAVSEFYEHLKKEVKAATEKISKDKDTNEKTAITCPKCQEQLLLRKLNRKDNEHFYSCSGYLDKSCTATFSIDDNGQPVESKREVLQDCPGKNCGGQLTKRKNKKTGQLFYACTNYQNNCKITADEQGNIRKPTKPKKIGKKCPKCKKGDLVERKNSSGVAFSACDRYPKCKHTESL